MPTTIAQPSHTPVKQVTPRPLRVAYILHRFPYLTETFIMREMAWIRDQGVQLSIYSLLPPIHDVVHQQARELLPQVRYSALISWPVFTAQLHFLRRSPLRYIKSLLKTIWQTYREPSVLLRALVIFPVSVFFARQCERDEIDHIHAHFVWIEGIAAGIAKDLLDIPFSIHPHAHGLFGRDPISVRRELENASQVITISTYHQDYIADLCPKIEADDVQVVHCGVEADRMCSEHRIAEEDTQDEGPIRILTVGRLMEKKGFEYLIDACALLKQRGVEFRCQIIGDGPLKDDLQDRIKQSELEPLITLVGPLSQEDIFDHYCNTDVFALPCVVARSGDRDGIPVVLMEAMAFELPVVTTPVSGIRDLVVDGETGLMCETRDAASLANALERLASDRTLRSRLGQQARHKILDEFEIRRTTEKMATIFRDVTRRNPRPGMTPLDTKRTTT